MYCVDRSDWLNDVEAPHVIRAFVSEKFHVTFPIFEKVSVSWQRAPAKMFNLTD